MSLFSKATWKTVARVLALLGVMIGVVGNGLPEGLALRIFLNIGLAMTSGSAFIANMDFSEDSKKVLPS